MPLKRLRFDQSIKNTEEQKSRITDPLVFFEMFLQSKDAYTSKYIPILRKHFLKINAVLIIKVYGFDKTELKLIHDCLMVGLKKLKWVLHSVVN